MNFKKITAFTAAISMLMFSGCSNPKDEAESTDTAVSYSASETTAAASSETETEAVTESMTEAVTESMTETSPTAADSITAEEAYSQKNGASWTDALMKAVNSWDKGNIVFKYTAMEDGELVTAIELSTYNNKMYMDTQIPGIMSMTMIIDGEKGYIIDKPSKSYSYDTDTTYDPDNEVESIVNTTADYSSFTEDGIKNIDGTDYIYEKFSSNGSDEVFYYSPDGKLRKVGSADEIMDLTIDLLDEPDESCFEIPADYTEISMDEMSMKMMSGLFGAISEMAE